jgi:hypothetical protein
MWRWLRLLEMSPYSIVKVPQAFGLNTLKTARPTHVERWELGLNSYHPKGITIMQLSLVKLHVW